MHIILEYLIIAVISLYSTTALAGANIGIWPVRLTICPEKNIGEIHLANHGKQDVNIQIYATSWDMNEDGEFIETDTGDFVFYPRLLAIPVNSEREVSVGYDGNFPPREKSYRLYFQELPTIRDRKQEAKAVKSGIKALTRLSLPLLVAPSKSAPPPQPLVESFKLTSDGMRLAIKNPGTHSFVIQRLTVQFLDQENKVLAKANLNKVSRILANRQLSVTIPLENKYAVSAEQVDVNLYLEKTEEPFLFSFPL